MLLAIVFPWLLQLLLPFTVTPPVETDPALLDTVSWQTKRLTWDDFKGRPDTRYMNSVALTSSGISVFYNGYESNPDIRVTCTFYRKKSWVKSEGRNAYVLQHEQLHFDITELHARKLRYAISRLPKLQRTWQNVQRLYRQANDDCDNYQTRYDRDTHHSILEDVQKEWNKRVSLVLARYQDYASR